MEGFSGNGSYQNGSPSKEAEFQRLAQNIGSNIQKIIQNGESVFLFGINRCQKTILTVRCIDLISTK